MVIFVIYGFNSKNFNFIWIIKRPYASNNIQTEV